jgi:hypothetical protein
VTDAMAQGRAVRILAWMLVFVAPAAAVASWFTPRPDLDEDDAAETALGALAEVGIDDARVDEVERSVHEPEDGEPVDVWVVVAEVGGEEIELRVQESVGQLVYVDDRIGPDDTERLLTDGEFERMGDYRNDATLGRWARRNAVASATAVLIAVVSYVLARRSHRLWETG